MGKKDDRIYTILVAVVAVVGIVSLVLSSNGGLSLGDGDGAIAGHAIFVDIGCSDETDSGDENDIYGEMILDDGEIFEDFCIDNALLREGICTSRGLAIKKVNCAFEDKVCQDGACVDNSGSCSDTDGGEVQDIAGITEDSTSSFGDSCDGNTLTEYFCSYGTISSSETDCSLEPGYICNNGACVDNSGS